MGWRGCVAVATVVAGVTVGCGSDTPERRTPVDVAARAAHTMSHVPGGLLVAGGCVTDGCTTATASAYVVGGGRPRRVADLHEARDAHTATVLADDRVLVTGGFSSEGRPPLTGAEVFDPGTGRWTEVGAMATGRGGHAAALLGDGRVLVAGGWVGPQQYTSSTEVFDPATGRFTPGPSLPLAVDGLTAASLPDGCVLLAGGQDRPGHGTAAAATVCPDGRLSRTRPLRQPRFKHGVAALPDGRVLLVGGTPDDVRLLRSTELYDPQTGRFSPGPTLGAGRYKLSGGVAVLPSGRVVVAGGGEGVEVLDPARGRSTRLARAGRDRSSFSTVGVDRGRVVVLGGYDAGIALTRTWVSAPVGAL